MNWVYITRNLVNDVMSKLFSLFGLILVSAEKPNVLVILLDDLGWADVSWNNHKVVATPFMEEMARNGTILVRNTTIIINNELKGHEFHCTII